MTQEEITGWKEHTTGKFEYLSFQGGHFYIKDHQKSVLNAVNKVGNDYVIAKKINKI